MRAACWLPIVAALAFCSPIHAQDTSFVCTSPLILQSDNVGGHFSFNPTGAHGMPTITAGRFVSNPTAIAAEVQGQLIRVTLSITSENWTTPPADRCMSTAIAPLAPGNYTVNAYSVIADSPDSVPQLFLSEPLVVAGGLPAPVGAPTLSSAALAALGLLLALGGFHAVRREAQS